MKKILLTLVVGLSAFTATSQVVFSVETPIQANYPLTYSNEGAAQDWGSVDLLIPTNAVLDTVVLGNDNTAADSLMCTAGSTAGAYTGKIVLLYRGDCEFGKKAFNAQQAGAVAVIIVNNINGDPIPMGAGTDGPNVTIPVVMISQQNGAALRALVDAATPGNMVTAFIGNKTGYYPSDLGTDRSKILIPRLLAVPFDLAQTGADFNFETGAWVHNYGSNDMTGITLTAQVGKEGANLYTEVSAPFDLLSGDSIYVAISAPFTLANYTAGTYELKYTIASDVADSYEPDNTVITQFNLTDKMISAARLDANGLPFAGGGTRPAATPFQYFSQCIVFRDANASRIGAQGIYFSASKNTADGDLEGEEIIVSAIKWNNQFNTLSDILPATGLTQADLDNAFSNLEDITSGSYVYETALTDTVVYAPFQTPFMMEDNQRYLFCVTSYTETIFLGYDRETKFETVEANDDQPTQVVISNGSYNFGFQGGDVPTIGVKTYPASEAGIKEVKEVESAAFPNPAQKEVTVKVQGFNGDAELTIVDLSGKVISTKSVKIGNNNEFKVAVNELNNGMYIFNLKMNDGTSSKFNVLISK